MFSNDSIYERTFKIFIICCLIIFIILHFTSPSYLKVINHHTGELVLSNELVFMYTIIFSLIISILILFYFISQNKENQKKVNNYISLPHPALIKNFKN